MSQRPKKSRRVAKRWSGRFQETMADALVRFNASIGFDYHLAAADIQGSLAHCDMLARAGILTAKEAETIRKALTQIAREIASGAFEFRLEDEDIHLNIERRLTELTGDVGRKIHSGRSRNDQVALDTRLYTRDAIDAWITQLKKLGTALLDLADEHIDTLLPGYTHLQRAQPISLAHHLLAYFEMFGRDHTRLEEIRRRVNLMPLGSGALAGTTLPLQREAVAKALKFDAITANSMDAVSDRDYVVEFIHAGALIMMHLSRLSEEWVLWSTSEFAFLEMDDALCTGSSMMPQKKNPDLPELIRGKTGRVYGHLMGLLTTLKGLPLAYNKDLQEDKEPLFDTRRTIEDCLGIATTMLKGTKFNVKNMLCAAHDPFILATDLAEYLVSKQVPFRTAHEIVGKTVSFCIAQKKALTELTFEELKKLSPAFERAVLDILQVEKAVDRRALPGGTGRSAIRRALQDARRRLKNAGA